LLKRSPGVQRYTSSLPVVHVAEMQPRIARSWNPDDPHAPCRFALSGDCVGHELPEDLRSRRAPERRRPLGAFLSQRCVRGGGEGCPVGTQLLPARLRDPSTRRRTLLLDRDGNVRRHLHRPCPARGVLRIRKAARHRSRTRPAATVPALLHRNCGAIVGAGADDCRRGLHRAGGAAGDIERARRT
jgi:hypothetical protein